MTPADAPRLPLSHLGLARFEKNTRSAPSTVQAPAAITRPKAKAMFGCACEEGEGRDEQVCEADCCMQLSENPQQQQQTQDPPCCSSVAWEQPGREAKAAKNATGRLT